MQDPVGSQTELGHKVIADPEARMIGLHLFNTLLKVIPLKDGAAHGKPFNLPLDDVIVLDIACLHGFAKPTVAVLYQDRLDQRHVKTIEIDVPGEACVPGPIATVDVEQLAIILVALPQPLGVCTAANLCYSVSCVEFMVVVVVALLQGYFVIGSTSVTYHNSLSSAVRATVHVVCSLPCWPRRHCFFLLLSCGHFSAPTCP